MLIAVDFLTGVLPDRPLDVETSRYCTDTIELMQIISDDFSPEATHQGLEDRQPLPANPVRRARVAHRRRRADARHRVQALSAARRERVGRCNACVSPFFHLDHVRAVINRRCSHAVCSKGSEERTTRQDREEIGLSQRAVSEPRAERPTALGPSGTLGPSFKPELSMPT